MRLGCLTQHDSQLVGDRQVGGPVKQVLADRQQKLIDGRMVAPCQRRTRSRKARNRRSRSRRLPADRRRPERPGRAGATRSPRRRGNGGGRARLPPAPGAPPDRPGRLGATLHRHGQGGPVRRVGQTLHDVAQSAGGLAGGARALQQLHAFDVLRLQKIRHLFAAVVARHEYRHGPVGMIGQPARE